MGESNLRLLKLAFEAAGVVFQDDGDSTPGGVGVRLRSSTKALEPPLDEDRTNCDPLVDPKPLITEITDPPQKATISELLHPLPVSSTSALRGSG